MNAYQFYTDIDIVDPDARGGHTVVLDGLKQEVEPKKALKKYPFFRRFVKEEEAQEMFNILERLVQWDETDQHSDDDMIAVGKFESIVNDARKIIQRP